MKKLLIGLLATLFSLSFVLTGCQEGGIAQESYDELQGLYDEVASKLTDAADEAEDLLSEKSNIEEELEDAREAIAELQGEVSELIDRYILEGTTPAETAEKIVRYYHDTHVYDAYDLFVCADMAAEVWNMLKAQRISAVIAVGDIDNPINNIVQCNHSWVLAEIAPGEYLALETTGGRVVLESENPLYYRGWTYDTPSQAKAHQRLIREFNTRVDIVNDTNDEINQVTTEYNNQVGIYNQMITDGSTAAEIQTQQNVLDQLAAVKAKLVEVKESMEDKLYSIQAEMQSLATECGG